MITKENIIDEYNKKFPNPYTTDDLNKILVSDYQILVFFIQRYIELNQTEEEQKIIEQAQEIQNAPYNYARNPFEYDMDMEYDAELIHIKNQRICNDAQKIFKQTINSMPPNMRTTYFSIEDKHKERYKK